MCGIRSLGIFLLIPVPVLLAIKFFILCCIDKVESKRLKIFGHIVCGLLFISALVFIFSGVYMMMTGNLP
ncbi:MAG: hypothetical protein KAJ14_14810 [Candidatus Omnitrophica bacterium]|nr:hypothetical protein [Candidatus Omnitrophota bacterium]MCK5288504.1 hypothetical protein [Candidatus Omnitrophota bacterium]MCK5494379.1 hypothetical protein [Candidatus Omnitrophota bacterium]